MQWLEDAMTIAQATMGGSIVGAWLSEDGETVARILPDATDDVSAARDFVERCIGQRPRCAKLLAAGPLAWLHGVDILCISAGAADGFSCVVAVAGARRKRL